MALDSSEPIRTVTVACEVGFCFGVKRAITMAREQLTVNGPVYITGDLVHNRLVTDELTSLGLRRVPTVDGLAPGTMIVRAHGIPRSEMAEAQEAGMSIVDATCPIVHRATEAARTLEDRGCQVVIIGDPHHAEIKGILGALTKPALVIETLDELNRARQERKLRRKVGVIFQTTHALELCREIVNAIVFMCKEVQIINTVCRPVQNRQDDAVSIAEDSELMIIVGSRTSANTMELAALCASHNPHTIQIETVDELRTGDFAWATRIGLASGLSTPEAVVLAVRDRIEACREPIAAHPDL